MEPVITVKVLQANNGDCILLSFVDPKGILRNVLIDGGTGRTYSYKDKKGKVIPGQLKRTIDDLKKENQRIDLLILTHIDDDHIGGILKWFEVDNAHSLIDKVWFNSGSAIAELFEITGQEKFLIPLAEIQSRDTSVKQGNTFESYITKHRIWDRRILKAGDEMVFFGATIKMLSPSVEHLKRLLEKWGKETPSLLTAPKENDYSKSLSELIQNDNYVEDNAIPNGSSIAFLFSYTGKNLLFLADSFPKTIVDSLKRLNYSEGNPLKVDLVKVSHHGSSGNTSPELLKLISSKKFIISSNTEIHNLPNKQCLARIIHVNNECEIYFNYPEIISKIFADGDFRTYTKFKAIPLDADNLVII
ncbi:ComEC/Rec2 family competence protein [Chitinophaga sp. 30R24]|uniref:ComEC/Rec2 family competence protein n=1 Tax=Chitinophaga sp. 30R24 TaxID=3248838 RepID=UPI003B912223